MRKFVILFSIIVCVLVLTFSHKVNALGPGGSIGGSSNSGGGGGLTPGTNAFFANPENIVPFGSTALLGPNIWYVSDHIGSDSNNCLSPAKPCLTITHAMSLAHNNDIFIVDWGTYTESLTVSLSWISMLAAAGGVPGAVTGVNPNVHIQPPGTAVGMTLTGVYDYFRGFDFNPGGNADGVDITAVSGSASYSVFDACAIEGDYNNDFPAVNDTSRGNNQFVNGTQIEGGSPGVLEAVTTYYDQFTNTTQFLDNGTDIQVTTDLSAGAGLVNEVQFLDPNKVLYLDTSSLSGSNPALFVTGSTFNINTGILTWSQVSSLKAITIEGTYPLGTVGNSISGVASQQATIISSHITATPQTAFTASGAVNISDIVLTTNGTGLAGGTAFTITTDNGNGPATLCTETVANLGANKTISCANGASITKMVPFQLADTKHIKINCTIGVCTGAGTITVIPQMTRAVPYASLTNAGL